jgi:nucleoside-diphosphate-sugar epimerase
MKVLVLGGNGYIGKRLVSMLAATTWAKPVTASRSKPRGQTDLASWLSIDSCDKTRLTQVLGNFDAVVNMVAGDRQSIAAGALALVEAARSSGFPRIIHMSTMAVYGPVEGLIEESAPLDSAHGWYAQAKCEAEAAMAAYVQSGGSAAILRPGCVAGPGSEQWVQRIGHWLKARRLGDLGVVGDGWSNLVDAADVGQAAMAALRLPIAAGSLPAFNLAAPDSPRWNDYFVDFALQIGATPVRRVPARQIKLESRVAAPPLKILQKLLQRGGRPTPWLPEPIPPSLVRLWGQHIHLDSTRASRELLPTWTPYAQTVRESARWFSQTAA